VVKPWYWVDVIPGFLVVRSRVNPQVIVWDYPLPAHGSLDVDNDPVVRPELRWACKQFGVTMRDVRAALKRGPRRPPKPEPTPTPTPDRRERQVAPEPPPERWAQDIEDSHFVPPDESFDG
jgi:hypothetical protein